MLLHQSLHPNILQSLDNQSHKFNIILQGISECPSIRNLLRFDCKKSDFSSVSSAITVIDPDIPSGLEDTNMILHNLPVRSKLNSTADVMNVHSKRGSYPTNLVVKPDLTPQERQCDSLLLKER